MFNWRKQGKTNTTKRSFDELRRQLHTLDTERLSEIRGGQGKRQLSPSLLNCGGWMPQ